MFVQRPDACLFSLSFGRGPTTLLAVGGWIGSGELWHEVFGHLPQWRCVSVDHRGSGASRHAGPITIGRMADDLLAVAEAQRVGRCVLAAESAGVGVALEALRRAPGRFDGLVAVGSAWRRPAAGAYDGFIAALRADYDSALRAFVQRCLPEPGSDDLARWGLQILRRAAPEDAIELLLCRQGLEVEDHLDEIGVPVLIVHGERDQVSPPDEARRLAAALPDAELHVLPGLGHVPLFTAPAEVARLIDGAFIGRAVATAAECHPSPPSERR